MVNINLNKKRVLVTGGNGYIGTHLVNSLKESNANVYILDIIKKGVDNEFCVDVSNKTAVEKAVKEIQPEIIFHLAALLNRDRDFSNLDLITKVNYTGTVNLLLALKDIKYENFIFTSTSEVYGNNDVPFNEKMMPRPASPYSMSKIFSEVAIRTFSDIYKKNFTILRLFLFLGDNMNKSFFLPQLINSFRNEDCFKMTKGEQTRDYLYISDVIDAMLLTVNNEKAKNEIFNVCSGKRTSLKDFASDCKKIMNSNCRIDFGAIEYRENEVWDMFGDNSKIKRELGFKVNFDVKKIITEIVNKA